jgi:ABC transport system ATP-binding/permease protein
LAPIINARTLSKQYGVTPLFQNVSLAISEGDHIGLIGPNGSGKSTLLEILCGRIDPDGGEVATRKRARVSFVRQVSDFEPGDTVNSIIENALEEAGVPFDQRLARSAEALGRAGFTDLQALASTLSGGWRKRLRITEALVQGADVLLLDEPTNHLDFAGIEWLEGVLQDANFAYVVVSHDRYFLENTANEVLELNRVYVNGMLRVRGNYSTYLEQREAYLEAQENRQEALANRVRSELEWLKRGPKARRTKAKARIKKAHGLIDELSDLKSRSRTATAQIDFSATDRQTKQLIVMEGVGHSLGGRRLFADIDFTIKSGMRVGLVGQNGSGKTTLLRLVKGDLQPAAGEIVRADALRVVYFDQNRELDPDLTLRRALAPESDSVIYQDRVIHVASWAARFLFDSADLNQPVRRLSGGERARVLIAQLMLQPADVLLLDEPTNDLDIATLEILEESLLEFRGAMVLVSHDRFLLDRVTNIVLGLDGMGNAEVFSDHSQWDIWQREQLENGGLGRSGVPEESAAPVVEIPPAAPKKKLSYLEAREFETMEGKVADAERDLKGFQAEVENPAIMKDAAKLHVAFAKMEAARLRVEQLYARWAELEKKKN